MAEDVELADSVSMAMLLVRETLAPAERAVFVLREDFDLGHDEIAQAVDKTPSAIRHPPSVVRQIAHRARAHVAARRPRGTVSPSQTRDALAVFQRAVKTGDLTGLLNMIALDVVLLTDGGGVVRAAVEPVVGVADVTEVLAGLSGALLQSAVVNGHPALIIRRDGRIDTIVAVRLDAGLITGLYAVRNPKSRHA